MTLSSGQAFLGASQSEGQQNGMSIRTLKALAANICVADCCVGAVLLLLCIYSRLLFLRRS